MKNFVAHHPVPAYAAILLLWIALFLAYTDAQANDAQGAPVESRSLGGVSELNHLRFDQVGDYFNDSAITAQIKAAIIEDSGFQGLAISVETSHGNVILSGFVNTKGQIQRALEIAGNVRGVLQVTNGMQLKAGLNG